MPEPKDREEHVADASRIIAENGPDLQLWLADQGLSVTDGAESVHWGSLTSSLRSHGKLAAADVWIKAQKLELCQRWGVTRRSRTAGEICRRFVAAKMRGVEGASKSKAIKDSPELDILPDYHRWVIQHPDLVPLDDDVDDTVRKAEVTVYEQRRPAPGQEALNLLRHCQKDKSARQKMFDEAKTYIIESRKKKKETASETDQKEASRILDMKAEADKLRAKYGKGA